MYFIALQTITFNYSVVFYCVANYCVAFLFIRLFGCIPIQFGLFFCRRPYPIPRGCERWVRKMPPRGFEPATFGCAYARRNRSTIWVWPAAPDLEIVFRFWRSACLRLALAVSPVSGWRLSIKAKGTGKLEDNDQNEHRRPNPNSRAVTTHKSNREVACSNPGPPFNCGLP